MRRDNDRKDDMNNCLKLSDPNPLCASSDARESEPCDLRIAFNGTEGA